MSTPMPTAASAMSFPDALWPVLSGAQVRRRAWTDPVIRVFLADGLLKIRTMTRPAAADEHAVYAVHDLIVSEADLVAKDWIVCRDQ
jgi:hypothetical protein